jgi:hypothetical protein
MGRLICLLDCDKTSEKRKRKSVVFGINIYLNKFNLLVLASIITGQFLSKLFRIMQHRDIFIFNFKTIIRVFRFINCFPFFYPNEGSREYKKIPQSQIMGGNGEREKMHAMRGQVLR